MDDRSEFHGSTRLGDDGFLHVPIPPELHGREVEFDVVLRTASDDKAKDAEWRAFIEATAGKWKGEFDRPSQPIEDEGPSWA